MFTKFDNLYRNYLSQVDEKKVTTPVKPAIVKASTVVPPAVKRTPVKTTTVVKDVKVRDTVAKSDENKPVEVEKKVVEERIAPEAEKKVEIEKKPITNEKKVVLAEKNDSIDDLVPLTTENINNVGFNVAPKDDFIGAGEKTFYKEIPNDSGRLTLVYDFQPRGNQGKPALHLYFNANENHVSESLVCFSANTNLREMKYLIESLNGYNSNNTRAIHNIKSVEEFIKLIKS